MKTCEAISILGRIEHDRINNMHRSGLDWAFRMSQAAVAEAAGFPDRVSWERVTVPHCNTLEVQPC